MRRQTIIVENKKTARKKGQIMQGGEIEPLYCINVKENEGQEPVFGMPCLN
jgi:hypothetical protein